MPSWLVYILMPLSWIYGLIVSARIYLYKSGIYTRSKFNFPIICVGNITAGGTGKTPHIEWLIEHLSPQFKMAVLSRGYKRKTTGYLFASLQSTPAQIGDEPYQIKQKFKDTASAVSENRVLGIPSLLSDAPETQVVLMDDGFQHLNIQAGFNIILCDYNRPYYNDHLLPSGLLREPANGANRADVIIVTKCPAELTIEEQQDIKTKLNVLNQQHVFFSTIVYHEFKPLTQAAKELAFLPHDASQHNFHQAIALAGIAKPNLFINQVKKHFDQTEALVFSDHTNYNNDKINLLKAKSAKPNTAIITTEKDAVKLMDENILPLINQLPVWYLPMHIEIMNNQTNELINLLTAYINQEIADSLS